MATSNAELQAEIDRIMRMAVRLEPVDLRYDVNKDGRISSRDAYLVMSGAATIPPPPAPAPVVQQPWWVGQFASEADANFVDTNRNQQIEETERAAWRSQYDPNSTEYQQRVSQEQEAARQEAARQAALEQERLIQQQLLNQNTRSAAAAVGVNLPQNWFDLNSKQKADWFVANKVTEDQLTRAGVPASELQALKDVGYYDVPARDAAVEKERLSQQQLLSNAGEYIDPVTGKNYTTELSNYLTSQLNALGITSASQIEKRIIKGDPEKVELGPTEYLFVMPIIDEWGPVLFRNGPDGREYVNANQYEIGQTQGGDSGYTVVEARRKNFIPATPDVTKYYNKNTGQEITNQILFDDKVGTKYVLTDQGVQKQFDPTTRLSFQLAQYVDPSSTGGAWGTASGKSSGPGFGPEGMLRQLAQRFINLTGLTDLNKLGVRTTTEYHEAGNMVYVPVSVETYYDKDTGREIGFNGNLGGWGEGPGMTYANILFDDNGKPIIRTWGKDSNSVGDLLPILSMVLMAIPGIGQAVGSALLPTGVSVATATAVGNAVINAGLQVASGVPVEKAILNSAASLGVSQLVPNLSGNVYVDNAVRSVATAALTGGDIGNALANSLIATGGNELLGNTSFTGDKVVDSAIASAITSGVQAAATDGDVGASIIRGGIAGASGELSKQTASSESAKSGAGFTGEDVTKPTSVAGAGGNDTVTSGLGIDSVNAGVAQDNVLDLVQQDIDRISSNNVQGNLNAEQEIQSATPVEPGTSDFTIPGGTTVGEFAEPGTAGFSRKPLTTEVATTGTTGTTAAQDTPYVAPNGMHNRAAFIAAGGGTSDADYAKYVQAVNAVISEGKSGTLIKPSSVNSAGKQLPSTTGPVTTETPRVDSVLGSVAAQGTASFGQTFGGALSALGFTDAGKAVINKANALADAATVAEGPEITVGKQYINEAIDKLASSSNARDAFINLGNLVSTIYDNPKAFGAALGSETFEELLQIGTLRGGSFLTKELIASSIENGGGAYNTEYEKQITLGAPPEVAHESAQKAAGVAAGTTAALGLGVAGVGRLAGVGSGSTSVGSTLAKQTAQEALEAGTVTSAVDYALTGSIDVQNSLREALSDIVYGGPTSGVVQAGSNVISSQIPSSDTSSNVGVVVAVDPVSNQATVINNTGNVSVINGSNLSEGESVVLDGDGLVQQPSIGTNVVVGTGSTTGGQLTYGDDNVVAGDESNGVVLQNNNDGTSLVLTQGGGSTVVPSVDSSTGNQLQPGSTVVVNTTNNTASTAPVTQPTGSEVVSQDAGQVGGTGSALPSTPTGGASTGSTAVVTQAPQADTGSTASGNVTGGQVDTGSTLDTGTVTTENVGAGTGVETSTGIVLQNNGDGTVLVLTNNGNASIVSDVDNNTGGTLTTGSSVVVDNNTGTASSTGTGTGTGVSDTATGATTGATTAVDTSGAVTAGTGVTTGATTGDTTGATTGAVTGVTTGDQVDTGGTQVLPEITTVGGTTSTDSTGTSTLTPGINVELPETIGGGTAVEDNVSGGGGNDLIVGGGSNDVIAGETTGTTTEEDLLLEQIIKELETTTPVSEGVPITEPEFPEPPLVLPESPTINVGDRLTVRPVVDRGYRRPSVSPGSRVEESAQILPLRPGLSEGGTGGIEGTTEQEQEPVWNVRSLKLRRLLGI